MHRARTIVAAALALPALLLGAASAHASDDGLFAPESYRNEPLAPQARLDQSSSMYVADLADKVRRLGTWVNTTRFSTPVYTVGPGQPRQDVVPDDRGPADCLPRTDADYVCLADQWRDVPLPAGARAAAGRGTVCDCHVVVYQPSSDTLWEFWRFRWADGRAHASFGGRIENVSANPGHFTERPGRGFGATASSIPLLAGLQRIGELRRGAIDHAVNVVVHGTSNRFRWPAQRTDGDNHSPAAVQEGMRFRLPASLNVGTLGLSPYATMVARAVQRYGMVVTDTTGASTGAVFYAEDPTPTGTDPYPAIFRGRTPASALRGFPWDRLQVLAAQNSRTPLLGPL